MMGKILNLRSRKVIGVWLPAVVFFVIMSHYTLASTQAMPSQQLSFRLGTGLGIPYGVIGVNFEVTPGFLVSKGNLTEYLGISFGLGFSPGGIGYAVGVRVYPIKKEKTFQPRVSAYYGIVGNISYYGDWDTMRGIVAGGGFLYKISKKLAVDFEGLYILHCFDWDTNSLGSRFKVSVGLNRQF